MPRPTSFPTARLAEQALPAFWRDGYGATSVGHLVADGAANRHALYRAFADKRALLLACIALYRDTVVSPAFAPVEQAGAGLAAIAGYFETQIARAEAEGLPGAGCLIANLVSERAPHDAGIARIVRAHLDRLEAGFANALRGAGAGRCSESDVVDWARLLTVAAQGLWTTARVAPDAAALRRPVAALLSLIERALAA